MHGSDRLSVSRVRETRKHGCASRKAVVFSGKKARQSKSQKLCSMDGREERKR